MHALTDSGAFWAVLIVLAVVLYLLPTLVGLIRGVDDLALVFLVNLIGGAALIGWPGAVVLAVGARHRRQGDDDGRYIQCHDRRAATAGRPRTLYPRCLPQHRSARHARGSRGDATHAPGPQSAADVADRTGCVRCGRGGSG